MSAVLPADRQAFESAYKALYEWERIKPQFAFDDAMDLYVDDSVQTAWWAWETATLAERERMADSLAAKGFADSCVAIVRGGK